MFDDKIKKIKEYYNLVKAKKVDKYLIIIGVVGVIFGFILGISIINQIFLKQ